MKTEELTEKQAYELVKLLEEALERAHQNAVKTGFFKYCLIKLFGTPFTKIRTHQDGKDKIVHITTFMNDFYAVKIEEDDA